MEKATSQLLLEPDWMSTMAICDSIRGGDTPPKYAVAAIKKKFYHENPHVQLYGLQVMESVVKNCGAPVHQEMATTQFMEEMRELVKQSNDEKVKGKVLELIQTWGTAFKGSQKYSIVTETLNLMKAEGWEFPPIRESGAMFEADVAPEWAEGTVCHRCRTEFGIVTRQHHCRACGQVFCGRCSAKACVLPKFGIEKEVRVCDSCYEEHGPKGSSTTQQGGSSSSGESSPVKTSRGGGGGGGGGRHHRNQQHNNQSGMDSDLPAEYLSSPLSKESQAPVAEKTSGGKSEAEIKEEEELQLALALSQSEAEESEIRRKKKGNSPLYSGPAGKESPETTKNSSTVQPKASEGGELNPELMRYLQRDYWEQKEKTRLDSSTTHSIQKPPTSQEALIMAPAAAGLGEAKSDEELDEFVTTLRTQVEIFVNRMKSNSSRGRSIANDSSVQTLFMNAMSMHSQLLKHIQEQEDKRVYYEGLQDKLTQVKDARAALDALREEESERKRREAEEVERQRQIQMQQKLDLMRQKKQEYLQYQRQLALQRMQEQEREMQLRQEQAKQLYLQQPVTAASGTGMAPPMGMMPPQQQQPMYPGYMPQQQQQHPTPAQMPPQQQPYAYDPAMTAPPSYQTLPPQQQQQPMMPPPVDQSISAPPAANSPAVAYNMQHMASALPALGPAAGAPPNPAPAHSAPYAPQPPPPMAPNPSHMLPQQQHHQQQHAPPDQQQQQMVPPPQAHPQAPVAPDSLISFD